MDRARWRWSLAAGAALVSLLLAFAIWESGWDYIGVYHLRPYFLDTVAILAAGEAQRAGLDVFAPNPFDPFHRPHVYGPWWLFSGALGLTTKDAWWLGSLLAVAFIGSALWLLAPRQPRQGVFVFLLLASPPVLLGLERGNNDLVVFVLLASAVALLARPGLASAAVGAGVMVLSAALKLYPLVALAALLGRRERLPRIIALGTVGVAVFAVLWWSQRVDFARSFVLAPRPDTLLAYGIGLFAISWKNTQHYFSWVVGGYLTGAVIALALLRNAWRIVARSLPASGKETLAFLTGASCWLFCYLANNNYPYRAVLLLFAVPWWLTLAQSSESGERAAGRGLCRLLLLTLWLVAPKTWTANVVDVGGPDGAPAARVLLAATGVEQVLVFALSAVLAVAIFGWLWRRLRAEPAA